MIVCAYVGEGKIAILDIIVAYHMNSDIDVFGFRVETWVVGKRDCTHSVAVERYLVRLVAWLLEQTLKIHTVFRCL